MRDSVFLAATAVLVLVAGSSCSKREEGVQKWTSEPERARELRVVLEGPQLRRELLEPLVGLPAPALRASRWMNTEPLAISDLTGKVVLLDFWGAWCPPCRALIPHMKELHARYSEQGLVIIGVHTTKQALRGEQYVRDMKIPYPVCFDEHDKTVNAYLVNAYPDIYLIDRNGNLRYADIRTRPDQNIENAVKNLLAES